MSKAAYAQKTTKDKYALISRAKSLRHDELLDKIEDHMLGCTDEDCDICDLGQSGQFIDDDDSGDEASYDKGTRSSEGREGVGNIDSMGEEAVRESKGDKHNLMRHGQEVSSKGGGRHPGFAKVQSKIASQQGLSRKAAGAILASRTRSSSAAAKKANPRLKKVMG